MTTPFTTADIAPTRKALNLSRADLARETGIPYRTLEDWERGAHPPSPGVLFLLHFYLTHRPSN